MIRNDALLDEFIEAYKNLRDFEETRHQIKMISPQRAQFHGPNYVCHLHVQSGQWHCDCAKFQLSKQIETLSCSSFCAHVITLEGITTPSQFEQPVAHRHRSLL
jgi:hypothetical protein